MPNHIGYVVLITVLAIDILALLYTGGQITLDPVALLAFVAIGLLQVYHLYFSQISLTSYLVRPAVFIFAGFIIIFVIPNIIEAGEFFDIIKWFGIVITIFGFPILFIDNIGPLTAWRSSNMLPFFNIEFYLLRSIISMPNQAADLIAFSGIISIYQYLYDDRQYLLPQIAILCLGLFFTNSRAGYISFGIGVLIIFGLTNVSKLKGQLLVIGILIGTVSGIIISYSFTNISFSGRRVLWSATLQEFRHHPLFGQGVRHTGEYISEYISDHHQKGSATANSYLRILLTTGLVGLFNYLYVYYRGVKHVFKEYDNSVLLISLIIPSIVDQMFESYSFFGLGLTSFLAAVILGYSLQMSLVRCQP
ncbi:MAG: O-antigen ligase family protein [Halobacteriales archaeon]